MIYDYLRVLFYRTAKRPARSEGLLVLTVLFAFIALLPLTPLVWARPIFPDQEQWEGPAGPAAEEVQALSVIVKLKAQPTRQPFTFDLRDGLNASEAALLAVITNPYIVRIRKEKGGLLPQLVTAGVLAPPRVESGKGRVADSWLPTERLRHLKAESSRLLLAPLGGQLELESAWLEWQAEEAARLFLYRKMNSRRIIDLLRQIGKVYKEIYRAASKAEYKEQYAEQRATARLGYRKMKKTGRQERKELNRSRVGLNHALGLHTNIDAILEPEIVFYLPETIATAKALVANLPNGRLDFMALQRGIKVGNLELMNYILSRFNVVRIFIEAKTEAHWLSARGPGVEVAFPLFETGKGLARIVPTNGELLLKNYKQRLKEASVQIPNLVKGIVFLSAELERIDKSLPALRKAADEGSDEKSPVVRLLNKKSFMAVSLLRLRLLRKLMDAGIALEVASGTIIFEGRGL